MRDGDRDTEGEGLCFEGPSEEGGMEGEDELDGATLKRLADWCCNWAEMAM